MKRSILTGLFCLISWLAGAQTTVSERFYRYDPLLEQQTARWFDRLSDTARVGQMIVQAAGRLGKSDEHLLQQLKKKQLGGILLLNGTKDGFTDLVKKFNKANAEAGGLPLLYSADAEPSLINRKIQNTRKSLTTQQLSDSGLVATAAASISDELLDIGIRQNFAPVVDISRNREVIGNRSFPGTDSQVVAAATLFSRITQDSMLIATAKHFPGHGNTKGDTHKNKVYIEGELTEVANYLPLIEQGILSIMVGHLAIRDNPRWNTDTPATCSPKIVQGLLKGELGFRGLVITDAMGMGANDNVGNAAFLAAKAGNDMILMPRDENKLVNDMLAEMQRNPAFKEQVYTSVRKIIRLKLVLGLLPPP